MILENDGLANRYLYAWSNHFYIMTKIIPAFLLISFLALGAFAQTEREDVDAVLDSIHRLASEADFEGYFGLYSEGAIFMGTDADERWTITEFKEYAKSSFESGRGWTYVKTERNIYFSADHNTAWFDEKLENDAYGDCRGTGVLTKIDGLWRVTQYNLTVPIPNPLLREVAGMIKDLNAAVK